MSTLRRPFRLAVVPLFAVLSLAASSKKPVPPESYVGDDKCLSCHSDKQIYLRAAHHLTSSLPTQQSIKGSFGPGQNILKTTNPDLSFRLDATATGFTETAVIGAPPNAITHTEKIDFVIGSGRKGQTYLYWKQDRLFELPVSYWTELNSWVDSPGYRDDFPNFERPVPPRCLECHASYFVSVSSQASSNVYKKTGFVLGISCERCHGPGREHAARHSSTQSASTGEAIVNPAKLSRDGQVDICAVCHAGLGAAPLAPAFSYVPGEPLRDYINLGVTDPNAKIDVHGNQVMLLERSRCFESSPAMSCSTCHNVHASHRDAAAFSSRCLSCHQVQNCGEFKKTGSGIAGNCIDCHMPLQESNLIVSGFEGKQVRPKVRSHWIKAYPETSAVPGFAPLIDKGYRTARYH
jgi:Cytochrome c554 and c-prime